MKYIKKNENGSDTLEDENMNNEENKYLEVANFLNKVKKKDKTQKCKQCGKVGHSDQSCIY